MSKIAHLSGAKAGATKSDILLWYGSIESAQEYLEQERVFAGYMVNGIPDSVRQNVRADYADEDRFGEYAEFIQVEGSTAIVSVRGTMRSNENWLTRYLGIMTYETLANIMATLAADEGIDNALMDIDSPGGQAKGLDAATEAIRALRGAGKPVATHSSGHMMSGGIWIGSAGSPVMASKNAEVGSVGVIAIHVEYSDMMKKEGVTATVMRKGEEKALATPYEKLSEKAKEQIDRSMERSYSAFIDTLSENMGLPASFVRESVATGREFSSQEAKELGLIDEVISFNDAVSRLVSVESSSSSTQGNNWSKSAMSKKPIINAGAGNVSAEDAAAAIAAGVDPKSLEAPGNVPAEEGTEKGASASAEDTGTTESTENQSPGEPANGEEQTNEETEEETSSASTESDALTKMLGSLNQQLVDAKVSLSEATTQNAELRAGNAGFRKIAVEQTQRMRIAVGLSGDSADLEKMSDNSLVVAHEEVREQFLGRFKAGATSRVSEKDSNVPSAVVTRIDNAVRKATTIG